MIGGCLSGCGLTDRVDRDALDTLYSTEEVTDEVRDRYYEDLTDIQDFEGSTVVDVKYNGKSYHITDVEEASTLLFSVTQVVLYETKEKPKKQMEIVITQHGEITYQATYPILSVEDEDSGETKTYYAIINGESAEEFIMSILRN